MGGWGGVFDDSDLDVIGFGFGVRYEDFWGHRGFTHSLCFAAIMAFCLTWTIMYNREHKKIIACYLFLAIASHGVLDALTNGGLGIAFFSPFENSRYFFLYSPLKVSPIGLDFFGNRAKQVLISEAIWVWLPSIVTIIGFTFLYSKKMGSYSAS